jgi:HEAT repeat protein
MTDSRRFSEVLLRIRPPAAGGDAEHPLEAFIDGTGMFFGRSGASPPTASEEDAETYGVALRDWLFADESIRTGLAMALGRSGGRARLRVLIEEGARLPLGFCWEKLRVPTSNGDVIAAAHPDFPFSRFLPRDQIALEAASEGVFRLLVVVSSPDGLKPPLRPIDTEAEIASLREAWRGLLASGQMQVTLLARLGNPATVAALEADGWTVSNRAARLDALASLLPGHHGLHLVAHGGFRNNIASLLMENDDGKPSPCEQDDVANALKGSELRLVFLQACRSASMAPGTETGVSGLAAHLVAAGVPAVIAMQDFARMEDAREFAHAFYGSLLGTGEVDVSANIGRRALLAKQSGQWHIPVLHCRLRDAMLWKPDALRAAVLELSRELQQKPEVASPFPLDVLRSTTGTDYDLERGPVGPRLPLLEGSLAALGKPGEHALVILAGKHGRAKTAQLHRLYVELVDRFLNGGATPLLLNLRHVAEAGISAVPLLAQAVAKYFEQAGVLIDSEQVESRLRGPIVLLIDGDEDIGNRARETAFDNLRELRRLCPALGVYMTFDEALLKAHALPSDVIVLSVQLMTLCAVIEYLDKLPPPEGELLKGSVQHRGLFDIARVPWLLSKLLAHARAGTPIRSRSSVIERINRDNMAGVDWPPGMYLRGEEALRRAAWCLQTERKEHLEGDQVYELLVNVRGPRDMPLDSFRRWLTDSHIVCSSCEDGIRFAYPGFQSFWCAKHMQAAGEGLDQMLEDVTASLGRLSRLRWWQDTLVLLAGLLDSPDRLVRKILAGSSLIEGEQVFLAALCTNEATLSGRKVGNDVIGQILDALLWRSHPQHEQTVGARIQAIEALGYLQCPDAVPHLVSLALDPIRVGWDGELNFEYSGVRFAAVNALLSMQEATFAYVGSRVQAEAQDGSFPPELPQLLDAWQRLDSDTIAALMPKLDGRLQAIAVFAFSAIGGEVNLQRLLKIFLAAETPEDVRWASVDALLRFDPSRVTAEAVVPILLRSELSVFAAYMIGRLGLAQKDDPEWAFLIRCLRCPDSRCQGTALVSLAMLGFEGIRELAESLATETGEAIVQSARLGELMTGTQPDWTRLRFYALDSLRYIGNESSIEALRRGRLSATQPSQKDDRSRAFRALSFAVSEEIYWRLTKGLSGESYERPV